jgi:translation initiation factor IF-3
VKKQKFKVDNLVNSQIRAKQVRISGEGIESKIVSLGDALAIAGDMGLDLIEIAPNAVPPVCRIYDFSKFVYEKKQQEKQKAKNRTEMKEVQLSPTISDHDLATKAKASCGFLDKGDKVKVSILFKGRQNAHREFGGTIMLKFIDLVAEHGTIEAEPKFEGNRMISMFKPKKRQ